MAAQPNFKLSHLRKIGWERWDPIGLGGLEGTPDDEYDSYLLQAVGRLWNGTTEAEVADYLADIETEYMGLGNTAGVRERAQEVARELNMYVAGLRA